MQHAEYILVRFGELSTKGKNKKDFISRLLQNMRKALKNYPNLQYTKTHDRIYVHLNDENQDEVMDIIVKVFGISSASFAYKVESNLDAITEKVLQLLSDKHDFTFKVAAKRQDKNFLPNSDGINRHVASALLKSRNDLKVDVHNPDYKIVIEVARENTYIMFDKHIASGGYPTGVAGKGLVLLSGGIDSPVCSYLAMKRGVFLEAIHFAAPPYTSAQALNKVKLLAQNLSGYQGYINLHVVPFTQLQLEIYKHVNESYCITIMRRMMFRIAQQIAEKRSCKVLVTGESIGQVASQTLDSMICINNVINMPVIRPCACMDKLEIIDISKMINTYETSILPYEDCCTIFTPKAPVTKPLLHKCKEYEARFDWQDIMEKAINDTQIINIHIGDDLSEDTIIENNSCDLF